LIIIFQEGSRMAKTKQHGGKRAGSGRKIASPDGKAIVVAASVPGGLVEALDAYVAEHGISRSEAVTKAIRGLLGKRKAPSKG
jgi:hypothetical protein